MILQCREEAKDREKRVAFKPLACQQFYSSLAAVPYRVGVLSPAL